MDSARKMLLALLVGLVAGILTSSAEVQALSWWAEEEKFVASDGAEDDRFGYSVSISGDYAIVGAYLDDDCGTNSGSAYILERDAGGTWTQVKKLLASDGAASDEFGYSVSISGGYAIVAAAYDDGVSGSAYIFERDAGGAWTQVKKLLASDGAAEDGFGVSVSISGNYAIIGVPWDDDCGTNSGSAYIFEREGGAWTQKQKLLASDAAEDDHFGYSVSISGDYAIVGAHGDDDCGDRSGSAYIFETEGGSWTEKNKLLPSDGAANDYFGQSVSISGDHAIVGAHGDDDCGDWSGSAYIFENTTGTWRQVKKLLPLDGAAGDYFGYSVSISGDTAVVGAYYDDDCGSTSGSAYVFENTTGTWRQGWKLLASDGAASDYFAQSVSISGGYTIIGAWGHDAWRGSAYIFAPEPATMTLLSFGALGLLGFIRRQRMK